MKRIYPLFLVCSAFLTGCSNSSLEFKKEHLTGEEYCVAKDKLLSLKKEDEGYIVLKCSKSENYIQKQPVKSVLNIVHNGRREYGINLHEKLGLLIDGVHYPLDVIGSVKKPQEKIEYHPISLPAGMIHFGTVNEVTKRNITFFLSEDNLSKISAAKEVQFEITASSVEKTPTSKGYPIILKFSAENILFVREFKYRCVDHFLNKTGTGK